MYHEATFQVGARDTDLFGQCRPSAMMDFLQEAATGAAVALHVSREEMLRSHGVFWMLARIWYRLDAPVYWNERLTVQTWHRGGSHGASMYRDFDLFRDGVRIGEGVSLWVLADAETRKLRRVSDLPEFAGTTEDQAHVTETAFRSGLGILALNEKGADLESLYMELTKGDEIQ